MCERFGAAGAERQCAPAALIGRHRAARSTSPLDGIGHVVARLRAGGLASD